MPTILPIKSDINVLIAEDNPVVAKTIEIAIKKFGYQLSGVATDGEEAVKLAANLKPDVVLMDIQMPKKDGLKATKEITNKYSIPVIIITSHHSQDLVEQASKAGAAAFLVKPPNSSEIERAITIALARHHDMQELKRVNKELEQALEEINTLRGILPICASCKKIRDDSGYWDKMEHYISQRSKAEFSHGICPECAQKLYPDLAKDIEF